MSDELVPVYESRSAAYHQAFEVFLAHTDQKTRANAWLTRCVEALPKRRVFVDAGAGEGTLTARLMPSFQQTVAVEPNPTLREELSRHCPGARVHSGGILEARPPAADFVLCSHVFYYLPDEQWWETLEWLTSWLGSGGTLVVILQNSQTDCMKMLRHFLGRNFDLAALGQRFARERDEQFEVKVETDPARIEASAQAAARTIAEFMLNLLPMPEPPLRRDVYAYVEEHFHRSAEGLYRFSCDQDFLQIRRREQR